MMSKRMMVNVSVGDYYYLKQLAQFKNQSPQTFASQCLRDSIYHPKTTTREVVTVLRQMNELLHGSNELIELTLEVLNKD